MFGNGPSGGPAIVLPLTNFVGQVFSFLHFRKQAFYFWYEKAPHICEGLWFAVWTGLELFLKTPCIKGLTRGHFLGSPRDSPFNISLTRGHLITPFSFLFSWIFIHPYILKLHDISTKLNKIAISSMWLLENRIPLWVDWKHYSFTTARRGLHISIPLLVDWKSEFKF